MLGALMGVLVVGCALALGLTAAPAFTAPTVEGKFGAGEFGGEPKTLAVAAGFKFSKARPAPTGGFHGP